MLPAALSMSKRQPARRGWGVLVAFSAACAQSPPAPLAEASSPPVLAARAPASSSEGVVSPEPARTAATAEPPPSATGPGPSLVASATANVAPAADAAPPPVTCKSDDDCWVERGADDRPSAVARPKRLRGKKLRPCVDAGRTPACREGVCILRHWKC